MTSSAVWKPSLMIVPPPRFFWSTEIAWRRIRGDRIRPVGDLVRRVRFADTRDENVRTRIEQLIGLLKLKIVIALRILDGDLNAQIMARA